MMLILPQGQQECTNYWQLFLKGPGALQYWNLKNEDHPSEFKSENKTDRNLTGSLAVAG